MSIVIHFLAQEKTPKDLKLFQKVKMHVFFLLMQIFNPGGMTVDLQLGRQEEALDVQNVQAAAAFDCSAVEAPLCCDVAATDFVGVQCS